MEHSKTQSNSFGLASQLPTPLRALNDIKQTIEVNAALGCMCVMDVTKDCLTQDIHYTKILRTKHTHIRTYEV